MERLILSLRGPFRARDGEDRPVGGLSRRGLAILAALAADPALRQSRVALTALIWGDRGEEQARASLRQELSVLRRALPDGTLGADRLAVWLDPAQCRIETAGPGGILEDLDIASPQFEDWLRDTRAALARDWVDSRMAVAMSALEAGEAETAGAIGEEVLQGDPLNEEAVQLLLRAAARTGGKAAALRVLQDFTARLMRELDVAPAPETLALADALRAPETAPLLLARTAPVPERGDSPGLAVLPFDEIGGGGGDMFADGIVEEITNALSRVHEFHVIARQSVFALRGAGLPAPELAARLGCEYLVQGTVQRSGNRLRLSVQLIGGRDGRQLWSARFDDHVDDLFDLQDRIAAQVAGQLSPSLRRAEIARAETLPDAHRSAYSLTLSALPHFWAHHRDENLRAIKILDEALVQAPDYGPAWAYKSWALAQMSSYIWSEDPNATRAAAIDAARRAAALTSDHSPSLVALGAGLSMSMTDQTDARAYIDRALAIDPNNAWGWMRRGWLEVYDRHYEAALASFRHAEALSPLDPFRFNMLLGRAAVESRPSGDAEEALRLTREAMTLAPTMTWAYRFLALSLVRAGRMDEAREALRGLLAAYPGLTYRRLAASLPPGRNRDIADQYQLLKDIGMTEG